MGIALIAALSSGITIGAFSILNKSADSKIQDQSLDSGYAQPTRFTRVINRPAVETDFTTAAENTVNAVVSIKSISTPKQSQLGGFSDPFSNISLDKEGAIYNLSLVLDWGRE